VLGQCLIQTNRLDEAEQHLLRVEQLSRRYTVRPEDARRLLKQLVELYAAWNKPEEAERWRRQLQQTQAATDDQ
jgi:DNA repair ATPase RecN